jgi:uncharacterized protein YfbU (UPF0304 family)
MSRESEAAEILEMHAVLRRAYEALADPSGIDRDELFFQGFEQQGSAAESACFDALRSFGRSWRDRVFVHDQCSGDSHWPVLKRYRTMRAHWKACADPQNPTKEEMLRIIEAGKAAL